MFGFFSGLDIVCRWHWKPISEKGLSIGGGASGSSVFVDAGFDDRSWRFSIHTHTNSCTVYLLKTRRFPK